MSGESKWIRTDDYQLVRKENSEIIPWDCFTVLDASCKDNNIWIHNSFIVLDNDYLENPMEYLNAYGYESFEAFKEIYGEDWKQVFAECIAETDGGDLEFHGTIEEGELWLDKVKKGEIEI